MKMKYESGWHLGTHYYSIIIIIAIVTIALAFIAIAVVRMASVAKGFPRCGFVCSYCSPSP